MKCDNCGEENLEGASFCRKCGKKFKVVDFFADVEKPKALVENEKKTEPSNQTPTNDNVKPNINQVAVYCSCGEKLEPGWKFCPKCRNPITVVIKQDGKEAPSKEDDYSLVYICLYIISMAAYCFFRYPWLYIIAFIIITTGIIKCPNNRAIKILFWLTLAFLILIIIMVMILIVSCSNAARSCQ